MRCGAKAVMERFSSTAVEWIECCQEEEEDCHAQLTLVHHLLRANGKGRSLGAK